MMKVSHGKVIVQMMKVLKMKKGEMLGRKSRRIMREEVGRKTYLCRLPSWRAPRTRLRVGRSGRQSKRFSVVRSTLPLETRIVQQGRKLTRNVSPTTQLGLPPPAPICEPKPRSNIAPRQLPASSSLPRLMSSWLTVHAFPPNENVIVGVASQAVSRNTNNK